MSTAASACSGRRTVREPTSAVVLLERPPARGEVGARQQGEKGLTGGESAGEHLRRRRVDRPRGLERLEIVGRALVDQRGHGQVADQRLAVEHAQAAAARHLADRGRVDLPPRADGQHLVDLARLDDAQHPLLRLGDHDLERLHVGLAQRDAADVEIDPHAALGRHLRRRRGQPGGAEVLERDQQPGVEQLERALEQLALLERVADLHGRALGAVLVAELGAGQHGGPADPVAARARAEQHHDVADPGRGAPDQLVGLDQADAHGVDQAVLLVRALEVDLAADRGHADRVAVVPDARDRVLEQVARPRRRRLAEAQRVEDRDRPRADREHVAQDAADAGGGALERLDRARVVVRLDLERARHAVADVDRAGVLARAEHEPAALDGQRLEQAARVLVAAVLGPHQAEDRELDLVRLAPQLLDDEVVLGVGEPELAVAGGDHDGAPISASPSTEPVSTSTACSGCGISPSTLPASLQTPAMSRIEPLKL